MVRLDSRNGFFNGILFDPGNRYWDFVKKASVNVKPDNWYHIRIRFKSSTIKLFIDNKLITTTHDKKIIGPGNIGIFNERKRAFVNNFIIRKL